MQTSQPMTVSNSYVTYDSCARAIRGNANTGACAGRQKAIHLACLTNLCKQPCKCSLKWLNNFLACVNLNYACPVCQSQPLRCGVITSVMPQDSKLSEIKKKTAICNLENDFRNLI